MADALKRYWYVAAVFREPHNLVATIAQLRERGFASERLLVVANHSSEDARTAVLGSGADPVRVIGMHSGAAESDRSSGLAGGLRAMAEALDHGGGSGGPGEGRAQIYAQLREDIAEGALVLIASVADPDEQLLGARILLRGNCECVLTHEIAQET